MSLFAQNLGGYVVGSSTQGLLTFSSVVNLGGEAKISNLDLHAVVEEHVAQFQIPVYDLVVVQVLTAQEDLVNKISRLRFCDSFRPLVQLHQTSLSAKLQHDAHEVGVLEVAEELHQVHVRHPLMKPDLL